MHLSKSLSWVFSSLAFVGILGVGAGTEPTWSSSPKCANDCGESPINRNDGASGAMTVQGQWSNDRASGAMTGQGLWSNDRASGAMTGQGLWSNDRASGAVIGPRKSLRFLGFIGKALGVVGSILGIVHKTSSDGKASQAFEKVFGSLDRNLQAVTNVQETIDLLMTKSLDAIGNLDHKLDLSTAEITANLSHKIDQNTAQIIDNLSHKIDQSTAEILADIDDVSKKVDRNYGYLLKVFQKASDTYTSVEKTRLEMHFEFKIMMEFMKNSNSKIQSTITKLNNFVSYFVDEKSRISQLSRQERLATLLEENGFLQNLREARTPRGDSLQTFLFEVTSQDYAVPQSANDSVAFAALSSMYYGVQTQISVLWYLMKVNIYLADNSYRARDVDRFNDHMEHVVTDFQGFSSYLIGGAGGSGLVDQAINILSKVSNLKFVSDIGGTFVFGLSERVEALRQAKLQLQQVTLPLILDIPEKLTTQVKFDEMSLTTPIGFWTDGARVRYAVQFHQDNLYSRVGEWSDPFPVKGKANPRLRIPAHSSYSRIIFRKFNEETPQLVGTLQSGSESDFWDIDRDLYNAASGSDEAVATKEASILIANGANISAQFDLGRCSIHAAAMNGNTDLAKSLLLNDESVMALDSNDYTPLHHAAENGWANFIDLLIQNGSKVNTKTKAGSTPLHLAAANGYPSAVQALVHRDDVDLNAHDDDGAGPLHKAVMNGVAEVLQILFADSRTNLNIQSKGNFTPLHLSAMISNPETTEKLLTSPQIATNARSDGNLTALHIAAITGNVPALQGLVSKDWTNVNAKSVNGWTPLHYAVSLLKSSVVDELLKQSDVLVDPLAASQVTPLHIAVATDQSQVVSQLLEHGAAIEQPNDEGLTALHLAAINNYIDTMKILLDKGANVNARTRNGSTIMHLVAARSNLLTTKFVLDTTQAELKRNDNLDTPLDIALQLGRGDIADLIKAKLATINSQLISAASGGILNTTISLVKMGATLDFKDGKGYTALIYAVNSGHLDMVKYLVEKGAAIDARGNEGNTPLQFAAINNQTDVVNYLVGAGADVKNRNDAGYSPLHESASRGYLGIVTLLVNKGAQVNGHTDANQTPLALATAGNHADVVAFLKSKGGV